MSTDILDPHYSMDEASSLTVMLAKCIKSAKELESLLDQYEVEVGNERLFLKIHSRSRQLGNLVKHMKVYSERSNREFENKYLHFCVKFKELLLKLQTLMIQRKHNRKSTNMVDDKVHDNVPLTHCSIGMCT